MSNAHEPASAAEIAPDVLRERVAARRAAVEAPFPLPLTPFEYYYYSDDRPEYPMSVPLDLRFSGKLDRERFLAALRRALDRHPLLDARIDARGAWPCWIASGLEMPPVDWADESAAIAHPRGDYIDLTRETGVRVWVRAGEATTRVYFQVHHACCDGGGVLAFAEDVLVCYAAYFANEDPALKWIELHPARLATRGMFGGGDEARPSLAILLRDIVITAREWFAILLRRPAVLAAPRRSLDGSVAGDASREVLAFESTVLASEQVGALRAAAKSQGATLNDVLLRDLLLAVRDWNRQQEGDTRRKLCINMPVNVRTPDDVDLPAVNRIGFGFVCQPAEKLADRDALLADVHRQTQRIKQWKLGLYFLGGLAFACNLRGLVPRVLRARRCFATVVASNVGSAFAAAPLPRRGGRMVCGDVVLDRLTATTPLRRLTRAAIVVAEYGGEMTIGLRTDRHHFGREDTRTLLALYAARLHETLRQES